MATTFPYGYRADANGVLGMGTRLTRAQLEAQTTVAYVDIEHWRRTIALMEEAAKQGVPLGPGTGWRANQPDKPGFAPNGNSNHQGFMTREAVAFDMVPNTSWNWMEANCSRFGLRTFRNVNDEPWHQQPKEIPASRSWRQEPWDLARFNLPGPPPAPRVPRPVLKRGSSGLGTRRLINHLKFWKWYPAAWMNDKNNGEFGRRTARGVRNMQRALKVPVTGVYDRRTARALRNFLTAMAKL